MNKNLEFKVDGDFTYGIANPEKLPGYVLNNGLDDKINLNSLRVMGKKYLKRDKSGKIIHGPRERVYEISKTLAEVERNYGANDETINKFTEEFYNIITNL